MVEISLTLSSPVRAAFLVAVLIVTFEETAASTRLAISINGFQEQRNLDTLVDLGSSVSFKCNDDQTLAAGDLYFNDAATTLPRTDGAWIINSMSIDHQGAYRCCVGSLCEEVAVITVPPNTNVHIVAAVGEQLTLSCPLEIVGRLSQYYHVEWRVPDDMIVAESDSGVTVPWAQLNDGTLELTVGPLNSTLPSVYECVVLSFKRRNMIRLDISPKGIASITIPSTQTLHVNVSPSVIASGSNHFNVSCGVENGQTLYNAEYQFFHNGMPIGAPSDSPSITVQASATGSFTCSATQYSNQRTGIPSQQSPPVQAIVLEAPNLVRADVAPMSTNGCTQQVTGSLQQPQPVKMSLHYFFHSSDQPASCENVFFEQFITNVSAGETDVEFDVNLFDSRLDTRKTVYLTGRFLMDGVVGPCSEPIPLEMTAEPCPPPPPPLSAGEIAGIAVGGVAVVALVSVTTTSVILIALVIRRARKTFIVPFSKAYVQNE